MPRLIDALEQVFVANNSQSGPSAFIEYSGLSGSFVIGETVTGGTSGATAKVSASLTAQITAINVLGDFQVGETLTGGTSGATAVIDNYFLYNFPEAASPLVNGQIDFFESGSSSVRKTTYADSGETIPNPNPLILNGDGRVPNVFGSGTYRVVVRTSTGVQILQRDPVGGDQALNFGADWISERVYAISDVVRFDNSYYISQIDSNLNINPSTDGGANWQLIIVDFQDVIERLFYTNYAAIRALSSSALNNGQVATVTDAGIGGDGVLRNVAAHGLYDNGGTIIVIDADWYWERIYSGDINVKWFGAVGDGATYDSAAVLAAAEVMNNPIPNASGWGQQYGKTLYFPTGKYRISETIPLLYGATIRGDQSGLVNAGDATSAGTILLLSNTIEGGGAWTTSTLVGGNTISRRVMFSVVDGGPVHFEDIAAITENNNTTGSTFFISGNGFSAPYNAVGATQGKFRGVRVFAFGEVFRASRMGDITLENCGFELNSNVFISVTRTDGDGGFDGFYISNCTFFQNLGMAVCVAGTYFRDFKFSTSEFSTQSGSTSYIIWGYGGIVEEVKFSSSTFTLSTGGSGAVIRNLDASFVARDVSFSGCGFVEIPPFSAVSGAPTYTGLLGLKYSACEFSDLSIGLNSENEDVTIIGCTMIGDTDMSSSGGKLTLIGNNFDRCTNAGDDITLANMPRLIMIGNQCRSSKVSISKSTITEYKIASNPNVIDGVKAIMSTATAGSSGWTNDGTNPPEFMSLPNGQIYFRGRVNHSGSPAVNSILCSTPTNYRAGQTYTYTLPSTDVYGDSITVVLGTDGNIYFKARTTGSTGLQFDLSPIDFLLEG